MKWIDKLFNSVSGAKPADWTFLDTLGSPHNAATVPIVPDQCYVELYIDHFKLGRTRKFATMFDGVVYAFVETSREGEQPAKFSAVTKPNEITAIGDTKLEDVITINKRLFKVIPWRGNPLNLELGLFSVKTGNVASGIANYVVRLSNTISPGLTTSIDTFLPLVSEGLDLLAGQTNDVELELAVDTDLELDTEKYYALIRTPAAELDSSKISISKNRGLLYDDTELDVSYCLFSIRARTDNPDWGEIGSLRLSYKDLNSAILSGKNKDADEALAGFRRQVIVCPDLITADKETLIQSATDRVEKAFKGGLIAAATLPADVINPDFKSLKLYE